MICFTCSPLFIRKAVKTFQIIIVPNGKYIVPFATLSLVASNSITIFNKQAIEIFVLYDGFLKLFCFGFQFLVPGGEIYIQRLGFFRLQIIISVKEVFKHLTFYNLVIAFCIRENQRHITPIKCDGIFTS